MGRKTYFLLIFLYSIFEGTILASSDSKVLPKGVYAIAVMNQLMYGLNESYDASGNKSRIDAPFNMKLDAKTLGEFSSRVNELIANINELTGDRKEGDQLTAGYTDVKIEAERNSHEIWTNYGITDKLSAGLAIPVIHTKINVSGTIRGENNANEYLTRYPKKEGLTEALEEFSKINLKTFEEALASMGYENIENYDKTSLGDIYGGLKYRFYGNKYFGLALAGALMAPTGEKYNPDKIVQAPPGYGTWGLALASYADYYPASFFKTNITLQYLNLLPDKEEMRVSTNGSYFTANKENVNRDLGNAYRLIWSNTAYAFKNYSLDISYIYSQKNRDSYKHSDGTHIPSLENNTDMSLHEAAISVDYSTVPNYRKGNRTPPYNIELGYRKSLKGKNVTYANAVLLNLWVYF